MDFHVGAGLAALYQVGNEAEDLHFYGGRYAILTEKTSPAWQFTLIDSIFEGQRESAIREHEASLTLVNVAMRDVPVGIEIDRGYGDRLWGSDVRFENVQIDEQRRRIDRGLVRSGEVRHRGLRGSIHGASPYRSPGVDQG
jgi:hypothetical protein